MTSVIPSSSEKSNPSQISLSTMYTGYLVSLHNKPLPSISTSISRSDMSFNQWVSVNSLIHSDLPRSQEDLEFLLMSLIEQKFIRGYLARQKLVLSGTTPFPSLKDVWLDQDNDKPSSHDVRGGSGGMMMGEEDY